MLTYETALRLKAANFPQPAPAANQIWYDAFGVGRFVGSKGRVIIPFNWETGSRIRLSANSDFWAEAVYCPTAAEILQSLGQKYVLWFDDSPKVLQWFCAETGDLPSEAGRPFGDSNPAEACAKAWLKINEEK